ncbi:AraC family transcriptional regulator [Actinosynnema sp. ALI-1.44]|uniref:GlxA family transcriptional regulator n=1 Tax=Actinosynnema sp. ALI-1.44 TaxID=1933779 RepID=UPI00097C308A|nr:helix-turn-helix domain-containing protein [Actinosynnema sp. ALI-1.44]ONI83032.1 AraC family transcriptional regulator [Actinosynnema sp. ALI-1.44]
MHVVAVLAVDGVVGLELTIPCQVFGITPGYDVRVCAQPRATATTAGREDFRVVSRYGLADAEGADTVIVPGADPGQPPNPRVLRLLRGAADRGARVAAICTGAFTLAAAGLLDGRRATTHWLLAGQLAETYPAVTVDPSVLFVDEGQILTSAGVAAGLDLCLHLVRRDHGAAVAAGTARQIVMPPQRAGGQAQFIEHPDPDGHDAGDLAPTLRWMRENLASPMTLGDIAAEAAMSTRTLSRRFRAQTGTTPLRWLLDQRLQRARELLETTDLPVERVARDTGFGSAESLRVHFTEHVGTSPRTYRGTFRAAPRRR